MASGMTKTQLVRHLAETLETNNKTIASFSRGTERYRGKGNQEKRRVRCSRTRPPGEGASQGPRGTQPADRRTDSDQSQDRREVPRRQGHQRRHCATGEEVVFL